MSEQDLLMRALQSGAPAFARCLSDIGKQVAFPKGIPFQASQAKGTQYNATIGQVTDGAGSPLPLPVIAGAVPGLDPKVCFLYSPQPGHGSIREQWLKRQLALAGRTEHRGAMPFATHGLTHGISLIAELFADPDTTVLLPGPSWENYQLLFTMRARARIATWDFFADGGLNIQGLADALDQITGKLVVVLNFPANPTGYAPTHEEADQIAEIVTSYRGGPAVVVSDDAYQGVVHEPGHLTDSMYWRLVDRADSDHTAVVKVDGATKELLFFPSRIGFLTMNIADIAATTAMESKLNCLVRGSVGGPPGPSQAMMAAALADPERTSKEFAERLALITLRYRALRHALEGVNDDRIRPLPFNSAYFAVIDLAPSLEAEKVRRALISDRGVGLIALPGTNSLRIAYCSTRSEDLAAIVEALAAVVAAS